MDRLWRYWNSLSPQDQTAVIIGVAVTVVGGLILAVLGHLGKLSLAGLKRLFVKPPHAPPQQFIPQPITIKVETTQPTAPTPEQPKQAQPGVETHVPSPEIPRTHAIEFVPRRDKEGRDILAQLKEKLAPQNHQLIVLWGPGGVGKTRLANEGAYALKEAFDSRIVWVSADGRPDFTLSTLLDGIAAQLDRAELRQLAPEPKKEQVRELIASAPPLIVLDNFETIAPDEQKHCASFLAQDASCPALITTRAMIISNFAHNIPIDAMSPDEARKFLDELIAQAPDGEAFTEKNRQRIIQTAAANPLVMQWIVRQIILSQEPQAVLDKLSHGEGDAAQRVFDNSFNLPHVGDDGRAALLALSLFTPSASRPALAEVAGFGDDLERLNQATISLGALRLVRTAESGKRLMVEGLTRELAKARLEKDGHADEFRQRFVAHFLSYAQAHAQPTPEDYDALEAEKENVLGAIDVAFAMNDWQNVINIAGTLTNPVDGVLSVRGYWDEAIRWGEQAAIAAQTAEDEWGVAQFAGNAAAIRMFRGELDEARRTYQQALTAFKKLGSEGNVAGCLHQLAILAQAQGEIEEAQRLYNESLEINKRLGDQSGIAITLHQLAVLTQAQGEIEEARRLYGESLEIEKRLGNQSGIAITLHQLAMLAQDQGEIEEARRLYGESLEINKRLGDQSGIAITLHQLAMLAQNQGEIEEARRLYGESLEIKKRLGDQSGIAITLHQLGRIEEDENNKVEAARLFREALNIFERLKSPNAEIARRSLERVEKNAS